MPLNQVDKQVVISLIENNIRWSYWYMADVHDLAIQLLQQEMDLEPELSPFIGGH